LRSQLQSSSRRTQRIQTSRDSGLSSQAGSHPIRLRKKLRRASSLRSCTGRCSTLALTPAIDLRNQTSPTTRSKTTSPHPFEACLDTLMAGRHISLSHYCRLTTGHPDRRLDTSRSLHSVFGCRITSQSLHSVFGYRISQPASGYTFYSLHTAFGYLLYITTLGGNGSRKNTARRLVNLITIPYWAETVHGRTKHGVCFSSFSFIFLFFV